MQSTAYYLPNLFCQTDFTCTLHDHQCRTQVQDPQSSRPNSVLSRFLVPAPVCERATLLKYRYTGSLL